MAGLPMPPGGMPSPYLDIRWTDSPTTNYEINSVDAMQRQMDQMQAMHAPKDTFGPTGAEKHGETPEAQGHEAAPSKKKIHDNDWWNGVKNVLLGGLMGVFGGVGAKLYTLGKAAERDVEPGVLGKFGGRIGGAVGIGIGILASIFGL
jgi:hypothetical protein